MESERSYIELEEVGVRTARLFNRAEDVSFVMAFDEGPTEGLYPNPEVLESLIVSEPRVGTEGLMILSDI